ncbi:MAG TPA: PaaI family thioesterase [Ramlibacter sp.]|nr:PaaI family thioesterase [Ramlibacter sp.]
MHEPLPASPPEGFVPAPIGGVFAAHCGELFARWLDGRIQVGFRVQPHQVNPGNACHGGMLCTFADIVLSTAAHYQTDIPRAFLPTISLQMDFLAPAPLGSWVQGEAQILKVTKNLIFSQGLVHSDGVVVMRSSGVFRRGPLLPETGSDQALQLPGMK